MYTTFIQENSPLQINITYPASQKVKLAIESGKITLDAFDMSRKEIEILLLESTIPKFIQSRKLKSIPISPLKEHSQMKLINNI